MALAPVEDLWERARRSEDDTRPNGNLGYQNYVPPNLAPRPVEQSGAWPQPAPWREAPPPPPDPVTELVRWSLRRPTLAMIIAYAGWLTFWSLYAMSSD